MNDPDADRVAMELRVARISMAVAASAGMQELPQDVLRLPYRRRPEGYGVHLTKAERRGKTWQELQALRRAGHA